MTNGSIDVCNFDASWAGGPTAWRQVAGAAAALGIEMAHHEEPQISAHLLVKRE
jgi:D-galactarolactone cycloisomerase